MIERPSPNHSARKGPGPVDILVLHYTALPDANAALRALCDAGAASRVSAHYLIAKDGEVYRLVAEGRRAWHAGVSFWAGERDVNSRSVGIELDNSGTEPFAQPQMAALIALAREILARHPIPAWRVLGHSDVAPARKIDPGPLFDWAGLARAGIGPWPEAAPAPAALDVAAVARDLARFGYDVEGASMDERTRRARDPVALAIEAFQRRFRPGRIDGRVDAETAALVAWAARQVPEAPEHLGAPTG